MINRIARMDEDMYQEGIIGIRDGLVRDLDATDSYLLQAARFAMQNYRNRGRSCDNGSRHPVTKRLLDGTMKTYQKNMRPIPWDNLELEYHSPPDELALDRICAARFYGGLDQDEAEFVEASVLCLEGRHSEFRARRKMAVDRTRYDSLKQSTHDKFRSIFGT